MANQVGKRYRCAKCGAECQVPFKPRPVEEGGKPVLCKECFFAEKEGGGAPAPTEEAPAEEAPAEEA